MLFITGMAVGQLAGMEEYTASADTYEEARSGVKTKYDKGYVIRYNNNDFYSYQVKEVYQECEKFLDAHGITMEDVATEERSFAFEDFKPGSGRLFRRLADGDFVYKSWILDVNNNEYYAIFLMMNEGSLEFSAELRNREK